MNLTGIGIIAIPKSTATACGLLDSKKILYEIVMQKHDKYKELYERDQQTKKSSHKLYRKSLQDNVFKKNEYES